MAIESLEDFEEYMAKIGRLGPIDHFQPSAPIEKKPKSSWNIIKTLSQLKSWFLANLPSLKIRLCKTISSASPKEKVVSAISQIALGLTPVKTALDKIPTYGDKKPKTVLISKDATLFTEFSIKDYHTRTTDQTLNAAENYLTQNLDFSEIILKDSKRTSDEETIFQNLKQINIDISKVAEAEIPEKEKTVDYLKTHFGSSTISLKEIDKISDEGIKSNIKVFFAYNLITPEKFISELKTKKEALELYNLSGLSVATLDEFSKQSGVDTKHVLALLNLLEEDVIEEFTKDYARADVTIGMGDQLIPSYNKFLGGSDLDEFPLSSYCFNIYQSIQDHFKKLHSDASSMEIKKKALFVLTSLCQRTEIQLREDLELTNKLNELAKSLPQGTYRSGGLEPLNPDDGNFSSPIFSLRMNPDGTKDLKYQKVKDQLVIPLL